MIPIKTPQEIEIMKKGGKIAAKVLDRTLAAAQPSVSTLELDHLAEKLILEAGGKPSFKGFENYPFATCININEGVVHGLPTKRNLKVGDVVTVDLGIFYQGFHTDNARTTRVGRWKMEDGRWKRDQGRFLDTGREALKEAIDQCRIGKTVGDISHTIQTIVEKAGCQVTRELGGHGVGKKLHEPPFIPGFGRPGAGPALAEGMTLAVEVIYTAGNGKIEVLNDGWTIVTADGQPAGLFEHSIAITASGPIILTKC